MFSNIYLKNNEAKFLEEIKQQKKRGIGQEKVSGRGRETYFFLTWPEKKIIISWLQTTNLSTQKCSVRTSTSQLNMYSVLKNYMKSSLNTSILPVIKIVLVFNMLYMKTSI